MGIKFYCDACEHKLNVKAFLAGKKGVCPHCGASIRIPTESQRGAKKGQPASAEYAASAASGNGSSKVAAAAPFATAVAHAPTAQAAPVARPVSAPRKAPPAPDPISESPSSVWYVRPPSGGQFGPAKGDVMRRWIGEGRVSGDSLVWREGWPDWQSAEVVFPQLAGSKAQSNPDPLGNGVSANGGVIDAPINTGARTLKSPRGKKRNNGLAIFAIVLLALVSIGLLAALFVILRGIG